MIGQYFWTLPNLATVHYTVAPKSDSMGLFTSIFTILIADLMMSLDPAFSLGGYRYVRGCDAHRPCD